VQRSDPHFSFVAFDAIDDPGRAQCQKFDPIAGFQFARCFKARSRSSFI
jgi:hypothetical protein